jgi:solute carrier family 45 protein 1/2/4
MQSGSLLNSVPAVLHPVFVRSLLRLYKRRSSPRFSAALGWFPILFYTTLYVSELYKRSLPPSAFDGNLEAIDAEGARLGSRAQLFAAFLALFTNALCPLIFDSSSSSPAHAGPPNPWWRPKMHLATLWAISHLIFASCMLGTL